MADEHKNVETPEDEPNTKAFIASFWSSVDAFGGKDGDPPIADQRGEYWLEYHLGELKRLRASVNARQLPDPGWPKQYEERNARPLTKTAA